VNDPRIIVSLDFANGMEALDLVYKLDPALCRLKVGKELFTRCGPTLVEQVVKQGFAVFLDLKFHDIPATVAGACRAAAGLGVWMINVHAAGGERMLVAARDATAKHHPRPLLVAVTVLTSLNDADLRQVGVDKPVADQVFALARLVAACGLDGVVCSAQEATRLKKELGNDFILVTPGIRPAGSARDDQQRIMTPAAAIKAGSDYLVIGRPVTQAADPLRVLREINDEIKQAGLVTRD
jgi:orotidine-5'-phosphate decarboxylase